MQVKFRIQVGKYRGRIISTPEEDMRPTMGWAREVIFNWLQNIHNKSMLDACTGSGIFALEAISSGIKTALCIDSNYANLKHLQQQALLLDIDINLTILHHVWPNSWTAPQPFDLIFWDPPYQASWRHDIWSLCEEGKWLTPTGYLIIESHATDSYHHDNWIQVKYHKRGHTQLQLFKSL